MMIDEVEGDNDEDDEDDKEDGDDFQIYFSLFKSRVIITGNDCFIRDYENDDLNDKILRSDKVRTMQR